MRRRLLLGVALAVGALVPAAGPSAATPSPTALLARHVPILVLHPAEEVLPAPVDGFLADAELQRRGASGWEPAAGSLPMGGGDLRLDQLTCRASDGPLATPCYVAAESTHASGPVVYGAARRHRDRIELQYWIWYPWDAYSPMVPRGELWQVHEGDWEAVSVIVDLRGAPLHVTYSQHSEGVRRPWATAPKQGNRRVRTSRSARTPTTRPQGRTYSTRCFGEDGYLRVPGGQPTSYSATGPKGAAYHEQWRSPVSDAMGWPRG